MSLISKVIRRSPAKKRAPPGPMVKPAPAPCESILAGEPSPCAFCSEFDAHNTPDLQPPCQRCAAREKAAGQKPI